MFRVTQPYLNLRVRPRILSCFIGKNIILCILKDELPFKMHIFFPERKTIKHVCAYPTLKFSDPLPETLIFFIWPYCSLTITCVFVIMCLFLLVLLWHFLVILTHFTEWNFPPLFIGPVISVLRVVGCCCFYLRHSREMQTYYRVHSVRLSATLLGCLVCVIFNSSSLHSFTFKLI